jgi:hypothetical protein
MSNQTGKWMFIIGAIIMVAGLIFWLFHDKLNWIGKLPGDIHVEKENFRFYFPITTMILLSILISAIVALVKKYF